MDLDSHGCGCDVCDDVTCVFHGVRGIIMPTCAAGIGSGGDGGVIGCGSSGVCSRVGIVGIRCELLAGASHAHKDRSADSGGVPTGECFSSRIRETSAESFWMKCITDGGSSILTRLAREASDPATKTSDRQLNA